MRFKGSAILSALCALVFLFPGTSRAYVCAQVPNSDGTFGPSLFWAARDLEFTFYPGGTGQFEGEEEFELLRNSFAQWGRLVVDGVPQGNAPIERGENPRTTDLTFTERPTKSLVDRVGYNFFEPEKNENLIFFRETSWFDPATLSSVIGLTTSTYSAQSGEILDSDIEFNAVANTFVDCFTIDCDAQKSLMDLRNTAVHEIGHFLGLAHSRVVQSTMYASAFAGETKKVDLHGDDRDAVVFKYPSGEANGYCTADDTVGCTCVAPETVAHPLTASVRVAEVHDGTGGCLGLRAYWTNILLLLGLSFRKRGLLPKEYAS